MELIIFLTLTFSLSILWDLIISRKTSTVQSFNIDLLEVETSTIDKYAVSWGTIRMWIPTLSLILVSIAFHGDLSIITKIMKVDLKNALMSLLGPLIVLLALSIYVVLAKMFGLLGENVSERLNKALKGASVIKTFILAYVASITTNAIVSIGEELAWRGYLMLTFTQMGYNIIYSSLIIGLIWGLWHVPAIYLLDFSIPKGSIYKDKNTVAITYTLTVTMISLSMTPLVYFTGNIFLALTIHGAVNAYWGFTYMVSKNCIEKTGMGLLATISWLITGIITLFFFGII